jgi:arginyl-tRNA--protein-N-Asp/Glu arginylyltransferase
MKLLFSEARTDYEHYVFPYAVWAFPEPGETPADLFEAGFLPSTRNLDRFYLCRHLRVSLRNLKLTSENRRVLRKGAEFDLRLVARRDFSFDTEWRDFCKMYTDLRFSGRGMTYERLDSLFSSPVTTHVLVVSETATGRRVGLATLYLEGGLGFYYYAFYDMRLMKRNLGMFMMTSAVRLAAEAGMEYLYLGTCYSESALYKTQFQGVEFFNGHRWSPSLDELKYLISRQGGETKGHLLEDEAYRTAYCEGGLTPLAGRSRYGSRSLRSP